MTRSASRSTLLLLFVVALLLRLAPVDHGMPRPYVPDAHMVRNALGMLRDHDPVPEVGRYSTYPYLVPYMLLPVYVAEYAVGEATGAWDGPAEFGERAASDARLTHLPARVLMAVLGALTAAIVVLAARAAGLGLGAWVAGWLMATALLHVQFSVQERPWAAVVFFGALSLWAAVVHERTGTTRSLLLAGVAASLAFSSHQSGLIFLGLCGLAWAFAPGGWTGRALGRRLLIGTGCVALFAVLNLLVGQPYYLVHGRVGGEAVAGSDLFDSGVVEMDQGFTMGGQAVRLGFSLRSLLRLSSVLFGYDPVLVVLGVLGLVALLRRPGTRAVGVFAIVAAGFWLTNPGDHVRYLLPSYVALVVAGGQAIERLVARRMGTAVAAVVLALPLVQALRFGAVLSRTDTRALAETRLAGLPPGSRVAIDHYGPQVELSKEALERLARLRGELRTRERMRLGELEKGPAEGVDPGLDAVFCEDLFAYDMKSRSYGVRDRVRTVGDTPGDVLRALGVTHLLIVDRRPSGEERRPLEGLAEDRPTVWTVSPTDDATVPPEAFLPTEMDFPLTALWEVARPGPWMRLVKLAEPRGG